MKTEDSILVVGAGFVGLATATFLAVKGCTVTVVEKNPFTVESLNRGKLHFYEPTLAARLRKVMRSGRLRVTFPSKDLYQSSQLIFVAIDSADQATWKMKLTAFRRMAEWIGGAKRKSPPLVVLKSTNVLGFAQLFRRLLDGAPYGNKVQLAVNPEFLREGYAYEDTAGPWRIVIGAQNVRARSRLMRFYRSMHGPKIPIITTDWKSAELMKLASNLYLAHRLSFINEIALYARQQGLDIATIKRGIGLDPRIGQEYFEPGLGFGGSCLPKDCHLINSHELEAGFSFCTAQTALLINDRVLEDVVVALQAKLGRLKGKKIALLGAAFKPETDDTRGSQAVKLAIRLKRRGARIRIFDPFLKSCEKIVEGNFSLEHSLEDALRGASVILIGTAHRRFRSLKPKTAGQLVKHRLISDNFRILSRASWEKERFEFI